MWWLCNTICLWCLPGEVDGWDIDRSIEFTDDMSLSLNVLPLLLLKSSVENCPLACANFSNHAFWNKIIDFKIIHTHVHADVLETLSLTIAMRIAHFKTLQIWIKIKTNIVFEYSFYELVPNCGGKLFKYLVTITLFNVVEYQKTGARYTGGTVNLIDRK